MRQAFLYILFLFMFPDINAAIVSTALIGIVAGYRIMEGFVIQDHLRSRYAIIDSILGYIIYTAFGKIRVVCIAALGVCITCQFELFCRVGFGNGYEVVEFALFGSKRLIFVEAEVDAVEIVIIIYMRSFYEHKANVVKTIFAYTLFENVKFNST